MIPCHEQKICFSIYVLHSVTKALTLLQPRLLVVSNTLLKLSEDCHSVNNIMFLQIQNCNKKKLIDARRSTRQRAQKSPVVGWVRDQRVIL